jgi:hypothetical protein
LNWVHEPPPVRHAPDLRVEPGQLTDATLYHRAAQMSFKLVSEAGGEAIAARHVARFVRIAGHPVLGGGLLDRELRRLASPREFRFHDAPHRGPASHSGVRRHGFPRLVAGVLPLRGRAHPQPAQMVHCSCSRRPCRCWRP